jgi:hypothetical protein
MSQRAREFLDRWELENVGVVADDRKLREVVQLTARCRKSALAAGITADELRAAAAQDLIRDMLVAVTTANENSSAANENNAAENESGIAANENTPSERGAVRSTLLRRLMARIYA